MSVRGKTVVIVGASSGIGEALAYRYARDKPKLVLAARRKERLESIAGICVQLGAEDVLVVPTDVTIIQDCAALVKAAIDEYGGIDVFVYSVGQAMHALVEEITDLKAVQDAMFDTNFYGAVWCTHYAFPHLKDTLGRLVIVNSLAGIVSPPYVSLYSAAKHAVQGFYQALMNEEPEFSVTLVNAGYVKTELDDKKVMGDGSVKALDLNIDASKYMPASKAANKIVKAAKKKEKIKYLSPTSSMAVTLKAVLPGYINTKVKGQLLTAAANVQEDKELEEMRKGKGKEKKDRVPTQEKEKESEEV